MGFDFGSLKKETGTSLASKRMANVGEERIQHMYKLLPFLKTWYQENERNNKFQEFNLFNPLKLCARHCAKLFRYF